MSKIDNVKKSPFKRFDIIVYALIAALIVIFFVSTATIKGEKFEVISYGEKVFEYDFSDGSYMIFDADKVEVVSPIEFVIEAVGGRNVLVVDKDNVDVTVKEADCPGKECTRMKLSSGSIVCSPHSLIVRWMDKISDPTVG